MEREIRRRRARDLARTLRGMMEGIAKMRVDKGLSQEDVAASMGISQPAVAKLERYDANPTLSTVRRYALAVGVDLEIRVLDSPPIPVRTMHYCTPTSEPTPHDDPQSWKLLVREPAHA